MPTISIDVDYESLDAVVVECLKDTFNDLEIDDSGSAVLRDSFERVIAYYSVPGTYKGGMFDESA